MLLKQLVHFDALIEQGSFGAAAEALGLTQSALSQSLAKLEGHYGVRLAERGRFGVAATQAGTMLLHRARLILAELRAADADLAAFRSGRRGQVAVGLGYTIRGTASTIARFAAASPDIDVVIREGWSEDLYTQLLKGEIDLVISSPGPGTAVDPEIARKEIGTQFEVLVFGATHPLAELKRPVTIKDLAAQQWLTPLSGDWAFRRFRHLCEEAGVPSPTRVIRNVSIPVSFEMLRTGLVVSFFDSSLAQYSIDNGDLCVIMDPQLTFKRPVYLAHRRRSRLTSVASRLSASLQEAFPSVSVDCLSGVTVAETPH
jgi:DNA-binding transcriptional LysR family regulator